MSNQVDGGSGTPLDPREALLQIVNSYMLSQCIYVAAKLGVADLLLDGPRSSDELATASETDPQSLYRVMRALAGAGIFAEENDRCFRLTPMAELLRSGVPDSVQSWAVFRGDSTAWAPWGSILHSVRTGKSAFRHVHGEAVFDYLPKNPASAQVFDNAMRSISDRKFRATAKAYDFSGLNTIVDVAGGNGGLLTAILEANPEMTGTLAEMPHLIEDANRNLANAGLTDRCRCVPIDMFDSVPAGGDVYTMANIIHDWDDDRSLTILRNCRRAMEAGARLLLVELVLPEAGQNEFDLSTMIDIEMLIMTEGGRERTEKEYGELYQAAGFQLRKVIPTESWWSIVEGEAV